jgi:[ribosomal protein S18]-alanine N-acetyltransferase
MKDQYIIRKYQKVDLPAVLELFAANTPHYFSIEERRELVFYLENELEDYFVQEHISGSIVGSGGFNTAKNPSRPIISWDMIHPEQQGRSLVGKLLKYRIDLLHQRPEVTIISGRTSQLVYSFYEKFGFRLLEVKENYWADNFHLYEMENVDFRKLRIT